MIKIKVGDVYKAHRVRTGTSAKGDWELVAVRAEGKERREVTLFIDNIPSGLKEGDTFRVRYIESFTVNAQKDQRGEWTKDKMSGEVNIDIVEKADPCDVDFDLPGGFTL